MSIDCWHFGFADPLDFNAVANAAGRLRDRIAKALTLQNMRLAAMLERHAETIRRFCQVACRRGTRFSPHSFNTPYLARSVVDVTTQLIEGRR